MAEYIADRTQLGKTRCIPYHVFLVLNSRQESLVPVCEEN